MIIINYTKSNACVFYKKLKKEEKCIIFIAIHFGDAHTCIPTYYYPSFTFQYVPDATIIYLWALRAAPDEKKK